ncbi:MAG TPA: hypothetical protein ENK85_07770 [Saprospiraceae bacterium]|nr:hypothetical protein [Saprospiraceae bacterium]
MKNAYFFFLIFLSSYGFAQQNFTLTSSAQRLETTITENNQTIHICQLKIGHHYEISVLPNDNNCPIFIQNQIKTDHVLTFLAQATCQTFQVIKSCDGKTDAIFSIADLDQKNLSPDMPEDLLSVSLGLSADELVKGVLIGNNCSIDLNVQKHGEDVQFGTFDNGLASIGFDSGIIISTGHINNAIGPNNSGSSGTNVPNNYSDPDLDAIATEATFDAAVLEFDFTPVSNHIEFEYVFASEEYCEYVNKDYNDIFGFFISGPGIVGTKNIARIPLSGEVVSIDNVNHLTNSGFFLPNSSTCGGTTNMNDIQFDGFTQPLTATVEVQPCETYHIKLAISDVGDGIYDSAVFLKAGSFDAGDIVNVTPKSDILQVQNSLEGCNNGYLLFDRSCSNDITAPLTLSIEVLPSSTAIEGTDYLPLPSTVTIPAGVTSDSIPIFALDDGLTEGDETIVVEITGQYPCFKPTATITISDKVPIQAIGIDSSLCENTMASFQANVQGGIGPFSYLWNTSDTTPVLAQNFTATELLTCTVTDVCNNQSTASFEITTIPPSTGTIEGDGVLCNSNSNATINLAFSGAAPWDVTIEKDGLPYFTKQYGTGTGSFDVNQAGLYKIQSIESYGCIGNPTGEAKIENSTLGSQFTKTDVSCYGEASGQIEIIPINGLSPYHYNWSHTTLDSNTFSSLEYGDYFCTLTDANGCTSEQSIHIDQPEKLNLSVDSIHHVNCYFPQGGYVSTHATGGTTPYQYAWSQGGSSTPSAGNLNAGPVLVVVTDAQDCIDSIDATIVGDFMEPTTNIMAPDTINCYFPEITLSGTGSSSGANYSYQWTTTDGQIIQGETTLSPTINKGGTYLLTTTNTDNGCTSSQSVSAPMDTNPPLADAGTTFALNCTDTSAMIGTPNTMNIYSYLWNTTNGHFINQTTTAQTQVDAPGVYNLLVTNLINGCTSSDQVEITEIDTKPNEASLNTQNPTCLGDDGLIEIAEVRGGTPPYLYSYDGGQTFHDTTVNSTLNPGEYEIVIQDLYGCEYHQNTTLHAPQMPSLQPIPRYIIELGDSIRLETHSSVFANELDTVYWAPVPDTNCVHCLTPYAKPLTSTEYWITIVDKNHCEASAKINVMVQDPDVYIPNIFSPQGDVQANWAFTVFANPRRVKNIKQLHVYDRWGTQIFTNKDFTPNNLSMGWNGQYRDKKAPAGVYIYSAEVEFINGKSKLYSGDVTLVR